jgi:tetratricopeptide (TPR) repeat protein
MSARALVLLFSAVFLFAQSRDAEVAAHLQKGADAQGRRDLQAAVEEFRKALTLDPSRAETQARLGMVYKDLGKLPQAASAFEQALKLNPGIPGIGLLLAFTYQGMGKNREAIPYLESALDSEAELPVRVLAGQRLVDACFAIGDSGQGLTVVQKLRKLAPNHPDVLYTASKVYANLWNGAIEQLVNAAPGSYRVHQVFAEVFEAQDRFADAAKEYRQIIKMEPNLPGVHYRLGRMILRGGDSPENDRDALVEFRKELEIAPLDVPSYVEMGEIRFRAQNLDEAEKSFSRAIELQPDYVRGKIGLAKVFLARKEYQPAINELERAVRLAPDDEGIHYNLMLAYRSLKRTADAQRAYAEFQKIKNRKEQGRSSILNQLKGLPVQAPDSRQ